MPILTRAALLLCLTLTAAVAGPPSARDKAAKALSTTRLDLSFDKTPLAEATAELAKLTGVPIAVSDRVYQRFEPETLRVTLAAKQICGLDALAMICKLLDLEYGLSGGGVIIGDGAGKLLDAVTKVFYVADLALSLPDYAGPRLGFDRAYPYGSSYHPHGRDPHPRNNIWRYRGYVPAYGYRDRYRGYGYVPYDDDEPPVLGLAPPRLGLGGDHTAVPLGTPQYGAGGANRPGYQDRSAGAPWQPAPGMARFVARLQAATGGAKVWSREGAKISVTRDGKIVVRHTRDVVARVAAAIKQARR